MVVLSKAWMGEKTAARTLSIRLRDRHTCKVRQHVHRTAITGKVNTSKLVIL